MTPGPLTEGEDASTLAYFDAKLIEYDETSLERAVELIKGRASGGGESLLDIGCGVGNALQFVVRETGLTEVAGMDISPRCLEETARRVGCRTYLGSVLDEGYLATIEERFDFLLASALLHHLIGSTRAESKRYAAAAVANSMQLLKPGGHLVIHEPVFAPRAATWSVFWVKKALTRLTGSRIELAGKWTNIGPPVVSYLTTAELERMARAAGGQVADVGVEDGGLPRPLRLLLSHDYATVLVCKGEGVPSPGMDRLAAS